MHRDDDCYYFIFDAFMRWGNLKNFIKKIIFIYFPE